MPNKRNTIDRRSRGPKLCCCNNRKVRRLLCLCRFLRTLRTQPHRLPLPLRTHHLPLRLRPHLLPLLLLPHSAPPRLSRARHCSPWRKCLLRDDRNCSRRNRLSATSLPHLPSRLRLLRLPPPRLLLLQLSSLLRPLALQCRAPRVVALLVQAARMQRPSCGSWRHSKPRPGRGSETARSAPTLRTSSNIDTQR